MRKYYLLVFAIISLASCKRNWVCECQTSTTVVPVEINHVNREQAQQTCDAYHYGLYAQTGGCKLK